MCVACHVSLVCAVLGALYASALPAQSSLAPTTSIASMPLAQALDSFARQTGLQLVYVSDAVQGVISKGAPAGLTPRATLSRLLEGTGVTFEFLNERTVRIYPIAPSGHAPNKPTSSGDSSRADARPDVLPTAGANANRDSTSGSAADENRGSKPMTVKSVLARIASLFAVCGAAMHSAGTCAQQSAEGGGERLEEIVVTAEKRSEVVQDIPKTVEVVSQDKLLQAGVTQLQDLNKIAPSILGLPTPGQFPSVGAPPAIRGISTFAYTIGVQAQTGIVLDDVPLPTFSTIATDLSDVSQIEVLPGPQSTLSGRNAAGGLINIRTQTPSDQFHGASTLEQTGDGQTRFTGYVSGPIIANTLDGSISGYVDDWRGNVREVELGDHYTDGYHNNGARAKLLWTPSDAWTVTLTGFYTHGSLPSLTPVLSGPYITGSPYNVDSNAIYTEVETTETVGETLRIDHDLPIGTLSSITSYSHSAIDGRGGGLGNLFYAYNSDATTSDYTTQEFRLVSSGSSRLTYLGGLIYSDSDISNFYNRPTFLTTVYDQSASIKSTALYGSATWNFTDTTSVTGGLRGQHDEQDYQWQYFAIPGAPPYSLNLDHYSAGSSDYNFVSGEASLQHAFASDVKGYLTLAHSETGRAYDLGDTADSAIGTLQPLASESVNGAEIGLKTQWFDRRLTLNVDGFFARYEHYQMEALSESLDAIPIERLLSVGSVDTKGLEIISSYQPNNELTTTLNLAYTDAVITSYQNASCYFEQSAAEGCTNGVQNLSGHDMPAASKVSLSGSINYTIPFNSLPFDLQLGAFGRYQTREHFDTYGSPDSNQNGFGIMNLTMGIHDHQQHYTVEGFVNNVLNTHYYSYLSQDPFSATPLVVAQYGRDSFRYAGVRLKVQF